MLRTVAIVPAILTSDANDYRAQLETINGFTKRIQIDVSDGTLAPTQTLGAADVWWPEGWQADVHLMTRQPSAYVDWVVRVRPNLCIFHAESGENLLPIFEKIKAAGVKTGVAILPSTYPGALKPYIDVVDHVLIFAGQLGTQGSAADLVQIEKVPLIRNIKAEVEIGWDGGANLNNIRAIAHAGVDVINVGSALAGAPNPAEAYAEMVAETDKNGVML